MALNMRKRRIRNNSMFSRESDSQSGFALISVLLLATVTLSVTLIMAGSSMTELKISHNNELSQQALSVAEAGIHHAVQIIENNYVGNFDVELDGGGPTGGTGGALAALTSVTNLDGSGTDYRSAGLGGGTYYVRVDDNFDETPNNAATDADNQIIVTSRGRLGTAERVIEAVVNLNQPFYGLFGKTSVTISGGATADSYDSSLGPYGGANIASNTRVGSNGDIDLNGSVSTINGDASAAGSISVGSSTITGSAESGVDPVTFPPVSPCGPYSDGTGLSDTFTYDAVTGDLLVSAGGNVDLAAGTYCFNDITLTGGGTLTVGGPVEIYLTGDGSLSGGSVINNAAVQPIPSELNIFSSGANFSISGGASAYMTLYAPDATVSVPGGTQFWGSIVGDVVNISGGTLFHYDEDLATSGVSLDLVGWRELRN